MAAKIQKHASATSDCSDCRVNPDNSGIFKMVILYQVVETVLEMFKCENK